MAPKRKKTDPEIVELPSMKVAVVTAHGKPEDAFPVVMPALYGSVYTMKFDLKKAGKTTFKGTGLRGRYPQLTDTAPKEEWIYQLALPVPDDTEALPQKVTDVTVRLEDWHYGTVGQILHLGAYDMEEESVSRLKGYIEASDYEICGEHEEEYLTRPDAKVMKTIIRYQVTKKA